MITNLLATIVVSVVTNWTTVSMEMPVNLPSPVPVGHGGYGSVTTTLAYQTTKYHEVGVVQEKTFADIEWNGKPIRVELSSREIERLNRSYFR